MINYNGNIQKNVVEGKKMHLLGFVPEQEVRSDLRSGFAQVIPIDDKYSSLAPPQNSLAPPCVIICPSQLAGLKGPRPTAIQMQALMDIIDHLPEAGPLKGARIDVESRAFSIEGMPAKEFAALARAAVVEFGGVLMSEQSDIYRAPWDWQEFTAAPTVVEKGFVVYSELQVGPAVMFAETEHPLKALDVAGRNEKLLQVSYPTGSVNLLAREVLHSEDVTLKPTALHLNAKGEVVRADESEVKSSNMRPRAQESMG